MKVGCSVHNFPMGQDAAPEIYIYHRDQTETAAIVPANDTRITKILIFFLLLLIRLSLPLNSIALPAKEEGLAGLHKARTRNPIKASRHQSLSAPSAGKV